MLTSRRTALTGAFFCALAVFTATCAAREATAPAALPPFPMAASASVPAAPAPQPVPQPDPAVGLIALSTRYEVSALAQGDDFAEQRLDPATIDDLLSISTFEIPAPTVETTQAVADDLETTVHDIDIPLNAKVLQFVQLFSGRMKQFLEEGLSRSVRYLPMVQDVFRAEGLPLDLAYIPLVESAFKPSALSRAKARGIWQFMRGTALENGLTHDWYLDERADPVKATQAAAKYLKTLNLMFDGDWHLALASYNGGPGRVQRAMKRSGRKDFWKLTSTTRYLPRETRDYVPLVLAAIIVARNPAQYGLTITPVDIPDYETITLPAAVDLRRVAEWAGTPIEAIQDLNPELRRWTTPVRATNHELKIPVGTADMVLANLAAAEPDSLAPLNWHTVKRGETLLTISRKLKVSRADLAEANYLTLRSKVSTGQRLIIPRAPEVLFAVQTENPVPVTESRSLDLVTASAVAPEPEQTGREQTEPAKLTYRVKRGDTLFSIARLYRTTVASIKTWNRLRTNSIQVGQRLTIFTQRTATATN